MSFLLSLFLLLNGTKIHIFERNENMKEIEINKYELQVIDQREVLGKDFKIYGDYENPLFLAKDVAKWIGLTNVTDMTSRIDEDEVTKFNLGGLQGECNFLTENGLYEVLMQSRKPVAKEFKKQIKQILKDIRKTGGHIVEGREEEFINKMFPSFTDEVKLAMVQDLRKQNLVLKNKNDTLHKENKLLSGEVLSWDGRKIINALVRTYAGQYCHGNFGEAWVTFKKELLYKHSININKRITEYLNSTGKKTKPQTLEMLDDTEVANAVSTAVAMCNDKDVNIDDILAKYN